MTRIQTIKFNQKGDYNKTVQQNRRQQWLTRIVVEFDSAILHLLFCSLLINTWWKQSCISIVPSPLVSYLVVFCVQQFLTKRKETNPTELYSNTDRTTEILLEWRPSWRIKPCHFCSLIYCILAQSQTIS